MYSLATLMKQNGHDFIDILKVCCNNSLFSSFFEFCPSRLTPLIDRSISRVGSSRPSLHFSNSFPHYLSVSCSSKFTLGITTSRRSSSGGQSSKRRALDPSGPSPTSSTPTITAVAPHTWQRYVLFLLSRTFPSFYSQMLTPLQNIVLLHQYQRRSCAYFGIIASFRSGRIPVFTFKTHFGRPSEPLARAGPGEAR